MMVALPGSKESYTDQNLEKTFLSFPDAKDWDGSLPIKMLMLDGYIALQKLHRISGILIPCPLSSWRDERVVWTKDIIGFAKVFRAFWQVFNLCPQ